MKTIIRLYRSRGWRWQMRDARNGRVIGASTEGYMRQSACVRNLFRVTGVSVRVSRGKDSMSRVALLASREWYPA